MVTVEAVRKVSSITIAASDACEIRLEIDLTGVNSGFTKVSFLKMEKDVPVELHAFPSRFHVTNTSKHEIEVTVRIVYPQHQLDRKHHAG